MAVVSTEEFRELYSDAYAERQLDKFLHRSSNHWAPRIKKVFNLLSQIKFSGKRVLDLGTSIGTYAYEFASRGFEVTGIDLSEKSILVARDLARRNGKIINYIVGDVSRRDNFDESEFDLIYAGDIIEHLESVVLKETIQNCFYWLKPGGVFLFHTVPTKYDVVFHKSCLWFLLVFFSFFPDKYFKPLVHLIYSVFNRLLEVVTGKSWRQREKEGVHCNLQTKESIQSILREANYKSINIKLTIMEDRFLKGIKRFLFKDKEYFKKDIFGIARKPINRRG